MPHPKPRLLTGLAAAAAALAPVLVAPGAATAAPVRTTRVSVATGGQQADDGSLSSAISADGRFVAFDSSAANLVAGDTNGFDDVFLRDRRTGTTTRVSVSSTGAQGDSISGSPRISADGRYVSFVSAAGTLVAGDTDETWDVFLHDTVTGTTELVSRPPAGAAAVTENTNPVISGNGRYVAYEARPFDAPEGAYAQVYRYDRTNGETVLVSATGAGQPGTGDSMFAAISADGNHVAFSSYARDLAPGGADEGRDVYVRDLATGRTTLVSLAADGTPSPAEDFAEEIGAGGRLVLFRTDAALTPDDGNGRDDVYVRDVAAGTTARLNPSSGGASLGGDLTADGRYAFFESDAPDLVAGDTNGGFDVFRRELATGAVTLVSRNSRDVIGNSDSLNADVTPDGRLVVYGSYAGNLVRGDTNGRADIFVTDLDR